jgi:DNA-directed RNA polymerase beta' subunit
MGKTVQLKKISWDEQCEISFITGNGFEITDYAFIKNKEEKSFNGIQSPRFATDWEDEDAFSERYSCRCKELKGRVYEGEVCKICGHKVIFRDVNMKVTGWIKLGDYAIIQPLFYRMLKVAIGDKAFSEIIEYDKEITRDGEIISKKGKSPFKGIGLIEFRERFEEIMDYFYEKKKNKQTELFDEIMRDKHKVFASCIPVYSSVLRPVSFRGENFFFSSFDRKYETIFALSRLLHDESLLTTRQRKKKEKLGEAVTLSVIQKKVNELWQLVFNQVNQKDGHIRYQLLGGRINFSARNVVIPDPTLRADEIRLGYLTFLELYKYEIIALLAKMERITHNEAYEEWYKATINFDPKIYEVMMYIVKKWKPAMIINRNPTINYGSVLCMKVIDIKRAHEEDYTMSIPIQVLTVLNADFDGDVLNIVSLKTKELKKAFRAFNPRLNMFISRNDGLFNNEFNLLKDQLIGLYEFNNI